MKCAIIMAGGKGTRMKATCPKVMCNVLFEPMISYVVDAVKEAGAQDICVITGYKHELLEKTKKSKPYFKSRSLVPATLLCKRRVLLTGTWTMISLY